jgi:hypothetical protein
LAWGNRTKKIKTQAVVPFEGSGGYFESISIIAPGIITDCILGADILDDLQVIINFKDQCMYTKDENSSRRQPFVGEEMGMVELKEVRPIQEIMNSVIDGGERKWICNNEKKNKKSLLVLASDITCDNH